MNAHGQLAVAGGDGAARPGRVARKATLRGFDAMDLLAQEHDEIKQLFRDFDRLLARRGSAERQAEIVGEVGSMLSIHAQLEEEIFYPAARWVLGGNEWINHAYCDHADVRALIARLDEMEPADSGYAATVALLRDSVVPHMDDEQDTLFPRLRLAGLDAAAVGLQMAQRRKALFVDVTRIGLPDAAARVAG